MSQPPSLTKIFAAIGGAIFLLAAAALGYMNWTRSASQLTALGEDYNATLAAALLNATRGELEPLLRAAVTMDGEDVRRDPRPGALREVVLGLAEGEPPGRPAGRRTRTDAGPHQYARRRRLWPGLWPCTAFFHL